MSVAVDVEGYAVLFRVTNLNNVHALEIDNFGANALYCRLLFFHDESEQIINTRVETLQKLLGFRCALRFRLALADDLPSLFTAVDRDRLFIERPELSPFHVRELDVIGKNIRTVQIAMCEGKESARGVNILHFKIGLPSKRVDH